MPSPLAPKSLTLSVSPDNDTHCAPESIHNPRVLSGIRASLPALVGLPEGGSAILLYVVTLVSPTPRMARAFDVREPVALEPLNVEETPLVLVIPRSQPTL